jgi:hypothetical protein
MSTRFIGRVIGIALLTGATGWAAPSRTLVDCTSATDSVHVTASSEEGGKPTYFIRRRALTGRELGALELPSAPIERDNVISVSLNRGADGYAQVYVNEEEGTDIVDVKIKGSPASTGGFTTDYTCHIPGRARARMVAPTFW